MKTAYELAMERLGHKLRVLSEEQKERLAEVDRRYDAKIAEARLNAEGRLRGAAGDVDRAGAVRDELVVELASLNEKREQEKERIRREIESESVAKDG
ncbi:MAG: hypothetical protein GXP31_05520 [Kiritimatiellaeota bacterium]|nr:hypothetical protein [Kiritimatiellota bacterium]